MEDKRFERLDVDEHGNTGPVIPDRGGGSKEYLFQGLKAKLPESGGKGKSRRRTVRSWNNRSGLDKNYFSPGFELITGDLIFRGLDIPFYCNYCFIKSMNKYIYIYTQKINIRLTFN